jgi:hypothetical protein
MKHKYSLCKIAELLMLELMAVYSNHFGLERLMNAVFLLSLLLMDSMLVVMITLAGNAVCIAVRRTDC